MVKTKIIRDGNSLVEDANSEVGKRIGYYEKALKDTIVVKKTFLQKVCAEWHYSRGEVSFAKFLLGKLENLFFQKALNELESEK